MTIDIDKLRKRAEERLDDIKGRFDDYNGRMWAQSVIELCASLEVKSRECSELSAEHDRLCEEVERLRSTKSRRCPMCKGEGRVMTKVNWASFTKEMRLCFHCHGVGTIEVPT